MSERRLAANVRRRQLAVVDRPERMQPVRGVHLTWAMLHVIISTPRAGRQAGRPAAAAANISWRQWLILTRRRPQAATERS